ncbi:hypothetical protein ACQXXB_15410 [Aeromonas veronii]|uniref:hypothetical protein n=1 Tax=Aeromonas veronii TaxID=654 RepID=UPI0038D2EAAA
MGLFNHIKSISYKRNANDLLKRVLQANIPQGSPRTDMSKISASLIEAAWLRSPPLFDGSTGVRPNIMTLVALSLANGAQHYQKNQIEVGKAAKWIFIKSLRTVLNELDEKSECYPLTSLDHELLDVARDIHANILLEIPESSFSEYLKPNSYDSTEAWDNWYFRFVKASGELNIQLKADAKGSSLIDFMDHAPLKRAYVDGVKPEVLAAAFAPNFDFKKFQQQVNTKR